MTYSEQPFARRFATLGDEAETVYDAVLPLGAGTTFGFRRPKGIKFGTLPETLRHMPDRVTATYMVEVCGMGRDGILKSVKVEKYEALKVWEKVAKQIGLLGVALFVWNSSKRQFVVLTMKSITKLVRKSETELGIRSFEVDGHEYFPMEWEWLVKEGQVGTYEPDN